MGEERHPVRFWIDRASEARGVRVEIGVIRGVHVRREDPELDRWKSQVQAAIRTQPEDEARRDGYRAILAGANNPAAAASPEHLLALIRKNGRLPRINTVVDAYNVESARLGVVASAHDLAKLTGEVRLITLTEPAVFHPLGIDQSEAIPPGEWTIRDDAHLLCRLNCKQSRLSSVGLDTRDVLIYVQGSPACEGAGLRAALDTICDAIARFNGGRREEAIRITPPGPPAAVTEMEV